MKCQICDDDVSRREHTVHHTKGERVHVCDGCWHGYMADRMNEDQFACRRLSRYIPLSYIRWDMKMERP